MKRSVVRLLRWAPRGHVFISYKRGEEEAALKVRQALRAAGFKVWWDEQLLAGLHWAVALDRALMGAGAVVVLWSPQSVQSDWVSYEASVAKGQGALVPATIAPCEIPKFFAPIQSANLVGWKGSEKAEEFMKLTQAVAGKLLVRQVRRAAILLACLGLGVALGATAALRIHNHPRTIAITLGPPQGIGDFHPLQGQCQRQADGAITLSVDDRAQGTFSGCCLEVGPLDLLPGDTASVSLSLDHPDTVVLKFENGKLGAQNRQEAWIVHQLLLLNDVHQVTEPLRLAGGGPIGKVPAANRFCMALVGSDGPAPNRLRVRAVSLRRR